MIFGYARVSSASQSLDMQLDALNKYGCERIFQEKVSGSSKERPELEELLKYLRSSDKIVVFKLDRLGRNLRDLISLVEGFHDQGIEFVSLSENIDTSTTTGKLIFNIFASLAEFERDLIRDRVQAGLEAARARGRSGGRPRLPDKTVELALKMYDSKDISARDICKTLNITPPTLYRWLARRKAEEAVALHQ